ncbi:hypothetical protein ACOSQ3_019965 [Xanthoceras sorbifolium]
MISAYDSMDTLPSNCSRWRTASNPFGFITGRMEMVWEALDGSYGCEESGNYCGFNFLTNSTICVKNKDPLPISVIVVSSIRGSIFFTLAQKAAPSLEERFLGYLCRESSSLFLLFTRCLLKSLTRVMVHSSEGIKSSLNNQSCGNVGSYSIANLPDSCFFLSMVPTIKQLLGISSYATIQPLLELGFDLGWSVECRDCIAAGASDCLPTSDQKPYNYNCSKSADAFEGYTSTYLLDNTTGDRETGKENWWVQHKGVVIGNEGGDSGGEVSVISGCGTIIGSNSACSDLGIGKALDTGKKGLATSDGGAVSSS